MGLWGWLMMGGLWLLLLAAAIVAVAWIFPRDRRSMTPVQYHTTAAGWSGAGPAAAAGTWSASRPLSILDDRLARGEIDIATYRVLQAELTSAVHRPTDAPRAPGAGAEQVP